ncbi:Uncharacterised protein [Legionella pneumophila]|nr:Uncharacterised protein [Legionella pneumophila]
MVKSVLYCGTNVNLKFDRGYGFIVNLYASRV